VLRKEQRITNDEVGLVSEGLNIWTSFVAFNPHLLIGLYASAENEASPGKSHFV
jgi:hypothetical protein